jgi:hypothetical protein
VRAGVIKGVSLRQETEGEQSRFDFVGAEREEEVGGVREEEGGGEEMEEEETQTQSPSFKREK